MKFRIAQVSVYNSRIVILKSLTYAPATIGAIMFLRIQNGTWTIQFD